MAESPVCLGAVVAETGRANAVAREQGRGDASRPGRPFTARLRETVPGIGINFDLVQFALIGTAYIAHLVEGASRGWPHLAIWTAAIVAFVLAERPKEYFLERGWALPYILLRLALATWAIWISDVSFLTTFLYFIIATEAWERGDRLGKLSLFLSWAAAYGVTYFHDGFSDFETYVRLLPWVAGLAFTGAMTRLAMREQEARERSELLLGELTEAHEQLQRYAEQAGELATTQERNRLAREIHDSLGHYLTIINVQLESAQALRARDVERADRAVGEAKRLASEALADVRRSVAALRPTALDTVSIREAIERQVDDFRQHSGLAVDLAIDGDEGRCSQAASLALYRTVQEGLTNIRKHAGATAVAVRLRFGPATAELTIADDGRGPGEARQPGPRADGSGMGLTGLRERLNLLGGSLDVRAGSPRGTELVATIPNRG